MLAELNAIRRAHGLVPLRLSRPLTLGGRLALARHGHLRLLQHDSRDGSAFWKRVKRFYGPGGNGGWSVGENLLWSTDGARCLRGAEALDGEPRPPQEHPHAALA